MENKNYFLYRVPQTQGIFTMSQDYYNNWKCIEYLSRAYQFISEKEKCDVEKRVCEEKIESIVRWKQRNGLGKRITFTSLAGTLVAFDIWRAVETFGKGNFLFFLGGPFPYFFLVSTGMFFIYHLIRLLIAVSMWRTNSMEAQKQEKYYYDLHDNFQHRIDYDPVIHEGAAYYLYLFPGLDASAEKVYSLYHWIQQRTVNSYSEALQYWEKITSSLCR